ncbi:MAG: hypothetical protein N2376_13500 [Clostridia bacterium]|nr:hypothetical protein [Clostridia bacterium]
MTIDQLGIMSKRFITVRIGNKSDAEFLRDSTSSEKFGDYPQNIVVRIYY